MRLLVFYAFFRSTIMARKSTEVTAAPTAMAATIYTASRPKAPAASPLFSTSASIAQ